MNRCRWLRLVAEGQSRARVIGWLVNEWSCCIHSETERLVLIRLQTMTKSHMWVQNTLHNYNKHTPTYTQAPHSHTLAHTADGIISLLVAWVFWKLDTRGVSMVDCVESFHRNDLYHNEEFDGHICYIRCRFALVWPDFKVSDAGIWAYSCVSKMQAQNSLTSSYDFFHWGQMELEDYLFWLNQQSFGSSVFAGRTPYGYKCHIL